MNVFQFFIALLYTPPEIVPAVKPVISPVKRPFPITLVSPPPMIVPYVANRSVRT